MPPSPPHLTELVLGCIRDDDGVFVLAQTDWFSSLCDVTIGEAVRLHTALQWVSDLQFDKVDFVLDSQ
jgi:hypothetical protein